MRRPREEAGPTISIRTHRDMTKRRRPANGSWRTHHPENSGIPRGSMVGSILRTIPGNGSSECREDSITFSYTAAGVIDHRAEMSRYKTTKAIITKHHYCAKASDPQVVHRRPAWSRRYSGINLR